MKKYHKSEQELEHELVKGVERLGGGCYKFLSTKNGVPDRIIIYKGNVLFVEIKTAIGRLAPIQKAVIAELESFGADINVIYGEVEPFFDHLRSLRKKC